jgi:DNA-directed RNA polymerase subunit RPC12/RpoP
MAKIIAAQNRLLKNVFICKNCSTKIRAESRKILAGLVKCRRCGKKAFRQIKKK